MVFAQTESRINLEAIACSTPYGINDIRTAIDETRLESRLLRGFAKTRAKSAFDHPIMPKWDKERSIEPRTGNGLRKRKDLQG